MQLLIAVTDRDWFDFLRQQPALDEVNFWRPRDTSTPRQLVPGMPMIFKLKKAHGNWIVGFGIFARHAVLPVWLAWDTFGVNNGAATFANGSIGTEPSALRLSKRFLEYARPAWRGSDRRSRARRLPLEVQI